VFRIVGQILVKNGLAVQSIKFNDYLFLGRVDIALESLAALRPDEISIIDLDGNIGKIINDNYNAINNIDLPLAIGGGAKFIKQHKVPVERMFYNSIFFQEDMVEQLSRTGSGRQSIVAYFPYKVKKKRLLVFNSTKNMFVPADSAWLRCVLANAQEIAFLDVEGQGTLNGFDNNICDMLEDYILERSYFSGGLSLENIQLLRRRNCAGYIVDNFSLYGNQPLYESYNA